MDEEKLKNFGLMIPKYAIHNINGCFVFNATGKEFDEFKKWVDSGEIIQLKANDDLLDFWINKDPHGLGRIINTLNHWFAHWKNPEKMGYSWTTFKIK